MNIKAFIFSLFVFVGQISALVISGYSAFGERQFLPYQDYFFSEPRFVPYLTPFTSWLFYMLLMSACVYIVAALVALALKLKVQSDGFRVWIEVPAG